MKPSTSRPSWPGGWAVCLALVALSRMVSAQDDPLSSTPEPEASLKAAPDTSNLVPQTTPAYPIDGYLMLGLRGRWAGSASDSDAFAFLALDGGDPLRHKVTFSLSARVSQDLAGGSQPGSRFFEVSDTYKNGTLPLLYHAYVDLHIEDSLSILRIGRQQDIETPAPAYYDGVHVRSKDDGALFVGGYGGLATHLFESTSSDDTVFGAYLGSRPWENGRLRLDWMRARDSRRTAGAPADMLSVGAWQTVGDWLDLDAFYSRFEGDNRDLRIRGTWFDPTLDLQVRASYYQLLSRITTTALEFDPFTSVLLDYQPYHLVSASASKGFGSRYRLAGGLDLRRLKDPADAGQFNRDFNRFYLTTTFAELIRATSSVNVTVDLWDGNGKEYATLGADLASTLSERLSTSVGTFFSKYKVRAVTFEEREDVRTYFLRLRYELSRNWDFDMYYNFEDTSIDDFNVFRVNLKWRF